MNDPRPLLVTGASGHLGRAVIRHLLETLKIPPSRIIATTRKPETLTDLAAAGVQVRAADFDDADSLVKAFAGAGRLLLVSTDAMTQPGQRLTQHRNAVNAAVRAGVAHVVYTSMPQPDDSRVLFAPDHLGTEQALAAAPLSWTILRNAWYFENLHYSAVPALAGGQWFSAAGEGGIAYIARDDLARAAAVALASAETVNRTLTLTGREALSAREVASRLSQASGKPLEVVDVSLEQLTEGLQAHGFPPALAAIFASFDDTAAAGQFATVTDDYARLTGEAPESFDHWLARHRTALAGA